MSRLFTPDGLSSVRSDGDDADRHLEMFFEEGDIVLELLREFVFGLHVCHVGMPSFELLENGSDLLLEREWYLVGDVAVDAVCDACLDGVELVEYIAFHHDEFIDAVDHDRVFQSDEVDPSAAPRASGHGTELAPELSDSFAGLVVEFGRERSAADSCTVGLEDAEDVAYVARSDTESGAGACADGIGRGDERVGTEVDVEHGSLSAFGENGLSFAEHTVDFVFGVDELELAEFLNTFEPLLFQGSEVVLEVEVQAAQDVLVTVDSILVFLVEMVEEIAYTNSVA